MPTKKLSVMGSHTGMHAITQRARAWSWISKSLKLTSHESGQQQIRSHHPNFSGGVSTCFVSFYSYRSLEADSNYLISYWQLEFMTHDNCISLRSTGMWLSVLTNRPTHPVEQCQLGISSIGMMVASIPVLPDFRAIIGYVIGPNGGSCVSFPLMMAGQIT